MDRISTKKLTHKKRQIITIDKKSFTQLKIAKHKKIKKIANHKATKHQSKCKTKTNNRWKKIFTTIKTLDRRKNDTVENTKLNQPQN